jgi:hypothetical protein
MDNTPFTPAVPKRKSFSGKSALVKEQKETRREQVDKMRCSVCTVPIMPDTKIIWCKVTDCPRTDKRRPTEEERRQLGIQRGY